MNIPHRIHPPGPATAFAALPVGPITLHLITRGNADAVRARYAGELGGDAIGGELNRGYLPEFDQAGRRSKWGFFVHN